MGAKGDEGLRGFKGASGPLGLQVRKQFPIGSSHVFRPSVHVVTVPVSPGNAGRCRRKGRQWTRGLNRKYRSAAWPLNSARVHLAPGDQRSVSSVSSTTLSLSPTGFLLFDQVPNDFAQLPNISAQKLKQSNPSYFTGACHFP